MIKKIDFDSMDEAELLQVEHMLRDQLMVADNTGNAHVGHDVRCLLDQCVYAREKKLVADADQ